MPRAGTRWNEGLPRLHQHSVAKHNILRAYLAEYFVTLVKSPAQEVLRVTFVDAFAGGGLYLHHDTGAEVIGSPFILLEAAREAEIAVNASRKKPVHFDLDFVFIEKDRSAFSHLSDQLRKRGYADNIGRNIHLFNSRFQDEVERIIKFVQTKSPRNGRAVFSLDQFGYKEVPAGIVQSIFRNLPSAEVLLTFAVDSFINFATDKGLSARLLNGIGMPDVLRGRSFEDIKKSERDWRLWIQCAMYSDLVSSCGARYYTPFFVRNNKGHGDYWLVHLSQHYRARDVMAGVHWKNANHFIHYGGAGLNMLQANGYDPAQDSFFQSQNVLGFEFDEVAKTASVNSLSKDIPVLVFAHESGINFGALFASTCNGSPATEVIFKEAVGKLIAEREIEVISAAGGKRRSSRQIESSDILLAPRQRQLFHLNR